MCFIVSFWSNFNSITLCVTLPWSCSVCGQGHDRSTHNLPPPPNRCYYYSWYRLLRHDQSCMLQQSSPSVLGSVSCLPRFLKLQVCVWFARSQTVIDTSPRKSNCISVCNLAGAVPVCSIATLGWHEVSKQSALVETNGIDEHIAM